MLSRKQRYFLVKALSLFSIVRGYNILVIVLAQYLAAIYIMAPELPLRQVVLDGNLLVIVLCSALVIAGGYIINSFYDSEKDLINKPHKSMLDRLVSQRVKIYAYFTLNFAAVLLGSYVSFRAALFFAAYIFGIWLYSHRLKKIAFLGNFVSATLAIAPFFAVFVYYKNFETVIFVHALFLFLLILSRELIKDMENLAGDLAQITFKFPFRIPPYFALVIRAIGVLEGIALVGNPQFAIIDEAFPYLSKRLLTDEAPRLRQALRCVMLLNALCDAPDSGAAPPPSLQACDALECDV